MPLHQVLMKLESIVHLDDNSSTGVDDVCSMLIKIVESVIPPFIELLMVGTFFSLSFYASIVCFD